MNKSEDIVPTNFETEEIKQYEEMLTTTKHQLLDNMLREVYPIL